MDDSQRAIPLKFGGSVTIEAFGLGFITDNAHDFWQLIAFAGDAVSGQLDFDELLGLPRQASALLERVITASLVKPEDRARIKAPDLTPVLRAIFELNELGTLAKNLIGLRQEHLTVLTKAVQSEMVRAGALNAVSLSTPAPTATASPS